MAAMDEMPADRYRDDMGMLGAGCGESACGADGERQGQCHDVPFRGQLNSHQGLKFMFLAKVVISF